MTRHTDVVTANVLNRLRQAAAGEALHGILDGRPDLVGLQEWGVVRHRLLRRTGSVWLLGLRRDRFPPRASARTGGYIWASPLIGGCPVGARADRFELVECHLRLLGWFERADRGARPLSVSPPRFATVATFRDRQIGDRHVSLLSFHLTPGVQARGQYRQDRPRLVERHRREVRNLGRLVAERLALGHTVYAVGDSNFDGLRLTGLTSAWEGHESEPGTWGHTARSTTCTVRAGRPG